MCANMRTDQSYFGFFYVLLDWLRESTCSVPKQITSETKQFLLPEPRIVRSLVKLCVSVSNILPYNQFVICQDCKPALKKGTTYARYKYIISCNLELLVSYSFLRQSIEEKYSMAKGVQRLVRFRENPTNNERVQLYGPRQRRIQRNRCCEQE